MAVNGGSGALEVVGGEKVEQRTSEHRKCQAALGGSSGGPSAVRGLACGEDTKPVFDGLAGETGPWPVGLGERAGVRFCPQDQQRSVLFGRQPSPRCTDNIGQVTGPSAVADAVQERELVGAGASKQGMHESTIDMCV